MTQPIIESLPAKIAALLILVMAGYFFGIDCHVAGFWALIINLPLNVYLVILQRWNRGRILQLLRRIDNRRITIACSGVRESGAFEIESLSRVPGDT